MAKNKLNDPGWDHIFEEAGLKYNIDPRLLKALMFQETGPDTKPEDRIMSVSPKGAAGPMQLLPSSFPGIDPYDPAQAIPAAAKYLAEGMDKHNDPVAALKYYHGGPDEKQWGTLTNAYPRAVANYYQQLGGGPQSGYPFPVNQQKQEFPALPENTTNYPGEPDPSHGYPSNGAGTSVAYRRADTNARSADQIPPPRGDAAGAVPFMERANAEAKIKMAGFLDAVNQRFGQQQAAPQQTAPTLDPYAVGNQPGFEEQQKAGVDAWNAARNQAIGYGTRMFQIDSALRAQEELKKQGGSTGPGTETVNRIRSFLLANSPEILKQAGLIPDDIRTADYDKLHKYTVQLAQSTANSLGPNTNTGLATTIAGSPNVSLSDMALEDLLKAQKALERMQQTATVDFMQSGKLGAEYPNYMVDFSSKADPRAFMLDWLTPEKIGEIGKTLTDKARQDAFANQVDLAERYGFMSAPKK